MRRTSPRRPLDQGKPAQAPHRGRSGGSSEPACWPTHSCEGRGSPRSRTVRGPPPATRRSRSSRRRSDLSGLAGRRSATKCKSGCGPVRTGARSNDPGQSGFDSHRSLHVGVAQWRAAGPNRSRLGRSLGSTPSPRHHSLTRPLPRRNEPVVSLLPDWEAMLGAWTLTRWLRR